jgi:MiaB/RimO family radical SAM methylthiotransferase
LNSFSEERILEAIRQSVAMGAKEVQLTSQDIGAYGADTKTGIARLMERIALIEGDFKVRIGMINPQHLRGCFDGFADALKGERFYKFVHMPIQSGSDRVLKDMGRNYTVEEFDDYVKELRRRISNVTIETDVIVGFPTETHDDFDATVDFVRRTRPEVTNISRFGARPHAPASKMRQQSIETINRRSLALSRAVRQVQHEINDRFIGKRLDVILTESNEKSLNGRSGSYRQIVIRKEHAQSGIALGSHCEVKITDVSANVLYGTAL